MADTNHTTPTRRAILSGIVAATAATAVLAVPAASAATGDVDAVLAAWRAWRPLEEESSILSDAIHDLYNKHPNARQMPGLLVLGVRCTSEEGIDAVCDAAPAWMRPSIPQLRESAKRELAAEWKRAEAFDERIGMKPLQQRLDKVGALAGSLLDLIENADGSSPVIVAAKLDCALSHLSGEEHLEDLGPSSIASAIRGLLPELPDDMRAKLVPIAAGEGTIGDIYRRAGAAGALS
jgi:hypothetical protein